MCRKQGALSQDVVQQGPWIGGRTCATLRRV